MREARGGAGGGRTPPKRSPPRVPRGRCSPGAGLGVATRGLSRQERPLLLGGERIRELAQVAVQDLFEVVCGQLDPVVRDAALRVVVGADLLRALARADLGLALRSD